MSSGARVSRSSSSLTWARPINEAATVEARFVCAGMSSIGAIRLPRLEVLDARPTRQWLAVSVDPALEYHFPAHPRLESVSPAEFVGSWGGGGPAPQFACRLAKRPIAWSFSTREQQPETAPTRRWR